ncbi:hypothetical protein BHU72_01225 [Desulfuribacillus stibiiarsenatis]|uniref:Uncharacterized protein n=1 Tax=Desulfuribacillus stibiiarsenatis TaxID=1390249 RepID=A0A1E5L9V8_9FIRM|nr:stage VI sporulation protein F [Desulfuribacillus stibiiarsenatis]OEH86911.1 hypothetical protein BHU72_01225 [Desulfuribacillus stibiiarsenatis]
MSNNIFEDEKFQQFVGKHGDQLKNLAKTISPETLTDEKQLKGTLKMLAKMANVKTDDDKLDQLVKTLKKHNFNPKDPSSLNSILDSVKQKKK